MGNILVWVQLTIFLLSWLQDNNMFRAQKWRRDLLLDSFDRDWLFLVKSLIEEIVTVLDSDINTEQSEWYSALIIFGVPDS